MMDNKHFCGRTRREFLWEAGAGDAADNERARLDTVAHAAGLPLPSNASIQRREESGRTSTSSVVTRNNEASRIILQELNTLIPKAEQQVDDAYAHMIRFYMLLPACPFRDKLWFARPRSFFLPQEQDVPEEDAMAPKRISTSRSTSTSIS